MPFKHQHLGSNPRGLICRIYIKWISENGIILGSWPRVKGSNPLSTNKVQVAQLVERDSEEV
jgi:hypothetical protein